LSYRKALVRLLDRPGGRFLLGKIATEFVRPLTGGDVEIRYVEGLWTRQIGPIFLPDSPKFGYGYADFSTWKHLPDRYAADTREYWMRHYSPQEGDTIVDVGAGRGEDTLTFSRCVGETGRVIAIEAHPLSFSILKNFCKLNRLNNVALLQIALMDKPGVVRMVESASSWTENAVGSDNGSSGIEVRAATFGDVYEEFGLKDIAFLKMNIEGAERYALPGTRSALSHVRQICVACHDFRSDAGHGEQFRTRAFVERYLLDHGFGVVSQPGHPDSAIRDHIFGLRPGEF
jgi:FkbM family methyltransferase